jgi:hypothetical protein
VAWRASVMQNQGGSVVLSTRAVGVDLVHAAAGECGELFNDRAVNQDTEAATAHCATLQRPAIDHHLARLIRHALDCSGQRHLITGPWVRYILDSKGDSDQDIWTLQSHSIDRIMYGVTEEVGLAGRMRRLSTPRRQCVWQCQRSAESAAMTVTTSTGHVSTVAVFDCSARQRSLCPIARSARCDVRWEAAVFVGPDETTIHEGALFLTNFVGSSCRSAARTSQAQIAL